MDSAYLDIKFTHLRGKKIFPFPLYLFNPNSKKYTPFLFANTPLVQAKMAMLDMTIRNKGRLAVARKDQETFFKFSGLTEEQIKADFEKEDTGLPSQAANEKSATPEQAVEIEQEGFRFKDELAKAIKNNDFKDIIDQVKKEVDLFKPTISHTVSLSRFLVNNLMLEDNFNNRIAAVSYCFAKMMNMNTEDVLADLICASFFHNIGITQLHGAWAHHGFLKLSGEERKKYMKHPKVSYHILKKVNLDLSERCYRIIMEHHERIDGTGYPQGKIGEQIEPLALLLGAVSHIFEYSTGRITGEPVQLPIIIKSLKMKSYGAGLEYQFGDTIIQTLTDLVETDDVQKKSKTDDKSDATKETQGNKDAKAA